MPQIPTVIAGGQAAVVQNPQTVPYPVYRNAFVFGESVAQFGQQLNEIGAKLQTQQNELDTAGLVGTFHGKMKELSADVKTEEPDPLKRSALFAKKSSTAMKDLMDTAPNRIVGMKFQEYVGKYLPVYAAHVHNDALQYMGEQQIAQTRDTLDSISRMYSLSTYDAERKEWLQSGIKLINENIHFTPEQAQRERKSFQQKSQYSYMKILGSTDIESLRERDAKGEFADVDPLVRQKVMDAAERTNATKMTHAQVARDKAMRVWGEGVEIAGAQLSANNAMTQEFINEYAIEMARFPDGKTAVAAWQKKLREQQEGIGVGNPQTERNLRTDLINATDPKKALQSLRTQYVNGQIGAEFYQSQGDKLQAQIHRQDDQARADKNQGESRIQTLQSNRYHAAKSQAETAFKTTGILDKFDNIATEAHGQFVEELDRRTDHLNANGEDSLAVAREILPKYIAQVQSRADSRLDLLNSKVDQYPNMKALDAARTQIGEIAYYEYIRAIKEINGIQTQKARLDAYNAILRQQQGAKGTSKATPRWGESK